MTIFNTLLENTIKKRNIPLFFYGHFGVNSLHSLPSSMQYPVFNVSKGHEPAYLSMSFRCRHGPNMISAVFAMMLHFYLRYKTFALITLVKKIFPSQVRAHILLSTIGLQRIPVLFGVKDILILYTFVSYMKSLLADCIISVKMN